MNKYFIKIEVKDGEVEAILKKLSNAQQQIYECYRQLEDIGVLTIIPKGGEKKQPLERVIFPTL